MKRTINYILSRHPSLYRHVLRAIRSSNTEKMTLLQLIKDGDIVFDIGANRGDFTVLFSHIVGRHGLTHAFEPVPPTFLALSQRIATECRYQNVSLNNFALGDTQGFFEIHVPSGDFGQASLRRHLVGSWSKSGQETFDCEIRTLDAYVTEKRIENINFVKLDVEGAELPALRGAQRSLDQFRPAIQLEFFAPWTEAFGYAARELITFLQTLGYKHFYKGDLSPLNTPVEEIEAITESQNVICSTKALASTNA